MAAKDISHLKEHFLSCDICMDIYEDPITLACYHTFCRKCYIRYCQENREATSKKQLQCPSCKQCSDVTNPGKKVDGSWNVADRVKPLKPSFIIRGLLDDFHSAGNSQEYLKGKGNGKKAVDKSATKGRRDVCSEHKSDTNYYCRKCKRRVCADCAVQEHMGCGNVVSIESLKSEMRSSLNNNKKTLCQQMHTTELYMKKTEDEIEHLRQMESKVREEIKMTRENAFKMIREWERKVEEELKCATEEQVCKLRARLKTAQIDLQMFQQCSEFINRSLNEENDMDMLHMYDVCQSGDISTTTYTDVEDGIDIQFEKSHGETDIKNSHLGNLKITKIHNDHYAAEPRKSEGRVSLFDTINMGVTGDKYKPELVDVSLLEVGGVEVVLAIDWNNHLLKSYYMKNNKPYIKSLQLIYKPCCVTRLNSKQVAVSFPRVSRIELVKVTPKMTIQSTFTTQRDYWGLTSLDENTLAAGCYSHHCVDILDIRGRVKKTLTLGGSLIRCPNYLSTTQEGNILVSDGGSRSVVCLTPGGDVVFTYSLAGDRALESAQGIATTTTGDILVVDSRNSKVIQLTGAGEYVRDLLTAQDGIIRPYGICVYKDKLYVTLSSGAFKVFIFQ